MQSMKSTTNSWQRQLFVCLTVLISSAWLAACHSEQQAVKLNGPIMGTQYNVTLLCSPDKREKEWQSELLPIMETVNNSMSTYLPDSEITRFNQSQSVDFQVASDELLAVFSVAQRVSEETGGAFDATVMPLVNLWGFGPEKKAATSSLQLPQPPSEEALLAIQERIGHNKLEFNSGFSQWRKTHPETMVDFSAVAKGYAVDQVSNYLMEHGCENHLIDIGGEIRAEGLNAKGKPWRIAIEKPDSERGFQAVIDITNTAVASSGDYRNFYMVNGKRYSHTLDPRTLKPIDHNLAAVTVLDPIAARADALATAFMVMGEEALDFSEEKNVPALFIFRSKALENGSKPQFQVLYSQAFEKYIVNQ